jgi:small subunit ribosomal protein S18
LKPKRTKSRRSSGRSKISAKYQLPPDADINYKNLSLLQKYLNDRGKMIPRRITGVSAKNQRRLSQAIKQARYLALFPTGGIKKR